MSTTIPTTISICIATTLSCFILFTLPSEQKRIDMQAASEGLAQSAQKIPPTKQPKISINQCGQIDDRFVKHLPDETIWKVAIDDTDCEQAQLEIQLPESNIAPWPVSPTATNIAFNEGTITWSESLNHSHIQTPYMARLVGAQTEPDQYQCLVLKCGGDVTGVDITPPEASFTMANDDVEQVTGNLIDIATNITNDDSLELSGYCESKSSKVTINNDRTKLAEVNCNCPNSEDNTEAKTKTATKITTEPKQESKCSWAYTVSIVHGITYQFNVTESDWINNISPATANFEVTVDTEAPRVSKLTFSDNLLTSDEVATVTLTFSESIKDFNSVYHITAQNGSLTPMVSIDNGKTWTGTFTPNTDIIATSNIIKVNNTYIDIAGNTGSPYQSEKYIIDTKTLEELRFNLNEDTGISDNDNITQNPQVDVITDEITQGDKWQYKVGSDDIWHTVDIDKKSGGYFLLTEDTTYEPESIQVRQISEFGNLGTISKNPEKIIIDNKQPALPSFNLVNDTGRYNNDNITRDAQVSVEIEPDASWQYRPKKDQDWQVGSDKNFFELMPNTTYKKGDIQVIQTDVAGNSSGQATNQADFIIDNIAPVPLGFTLADDTGTNTTDNITNNPQMNINTAVLEPNAIWHYSLDAGKSWTEGSSYHFDLKPGTYLAGDIQVTQTDLAGNTSPATNQEYQTPTLYLPSGAGSSDSDSSDDNDKDFSPVNEETILFDDTPPTSTISFALNKDTGKSSTDFITKNPQMDVRIEAMEEDAIWHYSLDAGKSWKEGSGYHFDLNHGTYPAGRIQARVTDVAGNSGTVFKHPQQIIIDSKAPSQPSFELEEDTGLKSDDYITNNAQINVFRIESGAIGQYQIKSADNDDNWVTVNNDSPMFIFNLEQNQTYNIDEIKVRQIDVAGNISDPNTNKAIFVIDNEKPSAPSFTLAHDTGIKDSDNITQNNQVNVAVETNAIWHYRVSKLFDDFGIWSDGSWKVGSGTSFKFQSDNGKYKIQLKQIDLAGNESPVYSSDDIITIDNTEPAQVLTFALKEDTGISDRDNITQSHWLRVNNISELNGELPWEYSLDNGSTWISGSDDQNVILLEDNTVYQAGSIQVRHYDIAGNSSPVFTNSDKITIDNKAPNPPSFALEEDTGPDGVDNITQNSQINVFDLEPNANWEYLYWQEKWEEGYPSNNFYLLRDHTYKPNSIKVRQMDLAGNISNPATNQATFVIDNEKPSVPSFTLEDDTGIRDSDNITQNPQVNVAVEENAIWHYRVNKLFKPFGQPVWSDNLWKVGDSTSFKLGNYDGKYKIELKQMDLAGNESKSDPTSDETIITIDNTAPAQLLTFALDTDTGISDNDNITQSRWLRVNTSELNGELPWEYSLDNGNNWISGDEDTILLEDNTVYQVGSIQVRHYDIAGNSSPVFPNSDKITIDNEAPSETLSFALKENTGIRNSDSLIRTRNPLIVVDTQLLEEKARWQYSLDAGNNWADGANGHFALNANTVYATGSIQVRQVDLAGNFGPVFVNKQNIEIDTLQPYNKLSFKLKEDTGTSRLTDYITQNPLIVVDTYGLEKDAIWQFSSDGGIKWLDGANGQFALDDNAGYAAGSIQVRQIDFAGNLGPVFVNKRYIEIDNLAPSNKLSFTLREDTGYNNNDKITSDLQIDVDISMLEENAIWQFSSDGGMHWAHGSGDNFNLRNGSYLFFEAGDIQVRQIDLAGNLGPVFSSPWPIIVNNRPELRLHEDTGISNSDNITRNPQVDAYIPKNAHLFKYKIKTDSGASLYEIPNNGTGVYSFNLEASRDTPYQYIEAFFYRSKDKHSYSRSSYLGDPNMPIIIDNIAPTFTSEKAVISVDRSTVLPIWSRKALYQASAKDKHKLLYSLSGEDAALLNVDANNGKVYIDDAKIQHTYKFIVTAEDLAGNKAQQKLTIYLNNPPKWIKKWHDCDRKIGIQEISSSCQQGWHNGVSSECDSKSDPAKTRPCAKDGEWSVWSKWSQCKSGWQTCGDNKTGLKTQTRQCSDSWGGKKCEGPSERTEKCTLPICEMGIEEYGRERHDTRDCTDKIGGVVVSLSRGVYVCEVAGSSCPSGWTQYENYTKTKKQSCWIQHSKTWCGGIEGKGDGCTTGEHNWLSNKSLETCTYTKSQSYSTGGWNRDCRDVDYTCTAKVTAVGCY